MKRLTLWLCASALVGCTQPPAGNNATPGGATYPPPRTASPAVVSTPVATATPASATATPGATATPAATETPVAAATPIAPPVTSKTGLKYEVFAEGKGAVAEKGKTVFVHYTGTLTDGSKFDSSLDRGVPIDFVLGTGRVIPGWEEGIEGMKVGEKRKLTIPPDLGYGERGAPPAIPPNSVLLFDVELTDVK